MSLLLVRYDFPGKRLLSALIDLPLSVSPVVVGLALVLVYNPRYGWLGEGLHDRGFDIVFATPGIVMATCFVVLPLIVREVVPVLEELGDDQEQAARSLGASGVQTFRRITLPGIRWAIVYGVVLSLARVARRVRRGQDRRRPQHRRHGDRHLAGAARVPELPRRTSPTRCRSCSSLASVLCLVVVAILRPSEGSHPEPVKEKK